MAADASGNSVITMRAFDPEIVGSIFTPVDLDWSPDAVARFEVSPIGDLSLIRSTHTARNSISRHLERHMSEGDEGQYFACLPLAGSMSIRHLRHDRQKDGECVIGQGTMALLNTRDEYQIAMSDTLDAIWLRMPSKLLRSHALSVDTVLGLALDMQGGLGLAASKMMYGLLSEGIRLSDRGARVFSQSVLSFIGEVITSTVQPGPAASNRGRRMILERARRYIDDHLDDDELSPLAIANGIGISARYLSEIFAAEGTSPMRWVRKRRLEMCRMELERNEGRQQLICEIAYSMGFANVSSFNRAFKSQFGYSPREVMAHGAAGSRKDN